MCASRLAQYFRSFSLLISFFSYAFKMRPTNESCTTNRMGTRRLPTMGDIVKKKEAEKSKAAETPQSVMGIPGEDVAFPEIVV